MNATLKALALRTFARVPGGRFLYRMVRGRGMDPLRFLPGQLRLLAFGKKAGFRLAGSRCLEIGTGWEPVLPYLLALGGARSVLTLDVNPWLEETRALQCWWALADRLPEVAADLGVDLHDLTTRFERADPGSMADLFASLGIEYRYPGDARATGLPDGSLDCVLSFNTLEHVTPDDLAAMRREAMRVLVPGGFTLDRIDPEDHFSQSDPRLTGVDFLRYSRAEWERRAGPLAYHNRLRARDHRDWLLGTALEVVAEEVEVEGRALGALLRGEVVPHADFAGYAPEELAARDQHLAGRKAPQT